MALPYKPVPAQLAPDDVLPAEIVSQVDQSAADAVELFGREHVRRSAEKGRHDVLPVFAAVARFELPFFVGGPLPQTGGGRLLWAYGFETAPRLVVGTCPLFSDPRVENAIFLQWQISDSRQGTQLIMATPSIVEKTPLPPKLRARGEGRDGAIYIGDTVIDPDSELRVLEPAIRGLRSITFTINYALNRGP